MGKSLNTNAQELGKRGGKAGGPARARTLSSQERSAIARKGAVAKNAKHSPSKPKKGY